MKKCRFLMFALMLIPSLTLAQGEAKKNKTEDKASPVISSPSGNMLKPEQSEIITAPSGKKLEPNESEFLTESKPVKPNEELLTSGKASDQTEDEVSPVAPVISVGKSAREIELPPDYSTEATSPETGRQAPMIKNLDDAKGLD